MTQSDRQRWDRKYAERGSCVPSSPAGWLVDHLSMLPATGRVLDLAAGDGCNSLVLAQAGWEVTAIDISPIGLQIGRNADDNRRIDWVVADLDEYVLAEQAFDLVLCFRFLDRQHLPKIVDQVLKPDGYLLAETFNIRYAQQPGSHIRNPEYLLKDNEWLDLFPGLQILEHDQAGTSSRLFARRP